MSKAAEIVTCNETADTFHKQYYEKLDKQVGFLSHVMIHYYQGRSKGSTGGTGGSRKPLYCEIFQWFKPAEPLPGLCH